jgi:small subunit ribosomal protein S8|tara:strand:+ start:1023 stop:1421 length:399 start_codon:yes stop_codon:yes gene_type:complete
MSFTDPIADMITRIRNGQLRKLNTVSIPNSRLRAKILDVLKDEGYISNYKILSEKQNNKSLIVDLKYNNGIPVIKNIARVSKPGRRVYAKANSIPKIQNGLGIAIVSTSMGIMSDNDARSKKIGGEVICRVF